MSGPKTTRTPEEKAALLAKFDAGAASVMADPEAFRRECDTAALAENPNLTKEQLDSSWKQMAEQFGL